MAHEETLVCEMALEPIRRAAPQTTSREICRLRDRALETPEERDLIIEVLEEYEKSGTPVGKAASSAIGTILTTAMLEILCEE